MLFELPIILSGNSFYIRTMRWELTALLEYLDLFNHFYACTVSVLVSKRFLHYITRKSYNFVLPIPRTHPIIPDILSTNYS